MKNKILVLALIAAVLTASLVLVGCHKECPDDGLCKYNYSANIGETEFDDCTNNCINDRIKENSVHIYCDC